jgi:hypothetical protein
MSKAALGSNKQSKQTVWIIWLAMLSSIALYAAIGIYLSQSGELPKSLDAQTLNLLMYVFGIVAIGTIFVIFLIIPRLINPKPHLSHHQPSSSLRPASELVFCVVRWALAESIAIYGLILLILGGSLAVFGLFAFVSCALLLYLAPFKLKASQ